MSANKDDDLLRWFDYSHLPTDMQYVSSVFGEAANLLTTMVGPCAERTVALRKLLEAKDAGVRAYLLERERGNAKRDSETE